RLPVLETVQPRALHARRESRGRSSAIHVANFTQTLSNMIQSMTGYAAASADSPSGRVSLELRSVNSRFLDLQFRVAEDVRALVQELCRAAMEELVAARAREGAKLAAIIRERIAEMRRRVEQVSPLIPQSIAAYQARLTEKLREAMGTGNDERIRAEVALF